MSFETFFLIQGYGKNTKPYSINKQINYIEGESYWHYNLQ